ncbi:hypothetical protein HNO88_003682 [Novosphingobium chloroacetimidivorans]|uniref:Uncharacterized protein n=1 Tax=Novosphingobium chloroacetimidivorans TaxID=1428314 RepID=A0A7W7KCJ9_9SPHN|nr:hypothetical protein [Novosphingobium chloroacetimidivorans]
MSVTLAFDHTDSKLEPEEVSGFLGNLAQQRLVKQARVDQALETYQAWRTALPAGKRVKGRIDVRMALTGLAVARMVALGRQAETREFELFAHVGKALMASGGLEAVDLDADCREARRKFGSLKAEADPWRVAYAMRKTSLVPAGGPHSQGGHTYSAFLRLIPRAMAFARLLTVVAQIYDAIPVGAAVAGSQWDERRYAQAEEDMAEAARKWLRLNQKFVFWFKAGFNPAMLAFLRLMADMDRPLAGGGRLRKSWRQCRHADQQPAVRDHPDPRGDAAHLISSRSISRARQPRPARNSGSSPAGLQVRAHRPPAPARARLRHCRRRSAPGSARPRWRCARRWRSAPASRQPAACRWPP